MLLNSGLVVLACSLVGALTAYGGQVSVQVERARDTHSPGKSERVEQSTVVWLTPLSGGIPALRPRHFQLVQKDKQFTPRLLVVPTGSVIDFPNQDPFFHNVFSLFNGKRFDLGLYEKGSTRAVHFDHNGVSYIFCNIHPKMHAVIIALSTPYFAITSAEGLANIPDVPAGEYEMNVWSEGADPEKLESLRRHIHVGTTLTTLGPLRIAQSADLTQHKNKYGEPYPEDNSSPY